uniref:Piezo_RRas_bdg domain-containing protein n=1 Tax=Globodera pallida TaxID=36090 RepID=A0A183CQ16_GLOPA
GRRRLGLYQLPMVVLFFVLKYHEILSAMNKQLEADYELALWEDTEFCRNYLKVCLFVGGASVRSSPQPTDSFPSV